MSTFNFTPMTDRELADYVYNANKEAQLIPDEYASIVIYNIEYYQEVGDPDYWIKRTELEELANSISKLIDV